MMAPRFLFFESWGGEQANKSHVKASRQCEGSQVAAVQVGFALCGFTTSRRGRLIGAADIFGSNLALVCIGQLVSP